jgi:hypothetical protein
MEMLVRIFQRLALFISKACTLYFDGLISHSTELVVGRHHEIIGSKMTAFTKWCPPENGVTTFENAEAAVDLALSRMGQKQVALMQCKASLTPLSYHNLLITSRSFMGLFK